MLADAKSVIYWDTSAILSSLFTDKHSAKAKDWVSKSSLHLISTLAYPELSLLTFDLKLDGLVKSPKTPFFVIPADAGIQCFQALLDPGLRRGDGFGDFLRVHQTSISCKWRGVRSALR